MKKYIFILIVSLNTTNVFSLILDKPKTDTIQLGDVNSDKANDYAFIIPKFENQTDEGYGCSSNCDVIIKFSFTTVTLTFSQSMLIYNIGDVDKDGISELMLISNCSGCSSWRSMNFYTLKNNKWDKFGSATVWLGREQSLTDQVKIIDNNTIKVMEDDMSDFSQKPKLIYLVAEEKPSPELIAALAKIKKEKQNKTEQETLSETKNSNKANSNTKPLPSYASEFTTQMWQSIFNSIPDYFNRTLTETGQYCHFKQMKFTSSGNAITMYDKAGYVKLVASSSNGNVDTFTRNINFKLQGAERKAFFDILKKIKEEGNLKVDIIEDSNSFNFTATQK